MNVTTQTVSQQFVKDHREAGSADLTGGKWERGKVEDFYAYLGIELLPWQREFVDRLDDAMARVQVLSFTPGRFDQLIENANQIARAMQPEPRYDEAQTAIDKIANSPARPREGYALDGTGSEKTFAQGGALPKQPETPSYQLSCGYVILSAKQHRAFIKHIYPPQTELKNRLNNKLRGQDSGQPINWTGPDEQHRGTGPDAKPLHRNIRYKEKP